MPIVEETPPPSPATRGRGASWSPANRFERLHIDLSDVDVVQADREDEPPLNGDDVSKDRPRRETQFFRDGTKSIITHNNSPDVGFETSLNPYRGCEHGCIYCYARPTHEHLGFSAGLDFESKIMVKTDAPELLRFELESPRWEPQTLVMSGVTDPYQPVEKKLRITRGCLEVLAKFRNPVAIITKKPSGDARYRSFARTRRLQCSCGKHFRDVTRSEIATRARATHIFPRSPPGYDQATSRCGNSSWCHGCPSYSRAHGSRSREDS